MVKKLFKHEFLAWLRVLPIIYGITLIVAAMHRLLQFFETDSVYYNVVFISANVMYGIALVATLAAPVVFGIQRFYKNMFTGEGYLTHTLPVTPTNHLWVKGLTAVAFSMISFIVLDISVVIIAAGDVLTELWKAAAYLWNLIQPEYIADIVFYFIEALLFVVVSCFFMHYLYFTCICAGHLFKKNRVLAAVGVYFGLYMITQIIGTVLVVLTMVLTETGALQPLFDWFYEHTLEAIHIGACGSIVIYSGLTAAYFLFCRYVLTKKLNLE